MTMRSAVLVLLTSLLLAAPASAQTIFVGMGDSIGEGVQSADAFWISQSSSYLNWIALKAGVPFPLPLIKSGPFGSVASVDGRSRVDPNVRGLNLAVSGADVADALYTRSDATTEAEINSETDLVLFPRQASQMEIVESLDPAVVVCWIGNNDVLGAVTSFNALDASQMTSVEEFEARFGELADRLSALHSAVVFVNIPDVTSTAFLLDAATLEYFTGKSITLLPSGSVTSLAAMFLIRLGLADQTLLLDPNWVLDADEMARIRGRVDAFNQIIAARAAAVGAIVVDVNSIFKWIVANPPTFFGTPLTNRPLGGLFSLDGVHPSNIGHAIIADQVIATMNARWGTSIPRLTGVESYYTLLTDPYWDKDLDGRAVGRPYTGLLETLAILTGFTGDPNDFDASAIPPSSATVPNQLNWKGPTTREEAVQMMKKIWKHRRR